MVEADINRPSNSAPASPMKILAGWKLNGRNPTHTPQAITATRGPTLSRGSSPMSMSRSP